MARLGPTATARLEAAGWRPGRRTGVAGYLEALATRGFSAPDVLVEFFAEFGGLRVHYPAAADPESQNAYIIDPVEAPMAGETSWIEIWSAWAGAPLCPFGEAARMAAVIAADGRVWLGFDSLLLYVAADPQESLNVLCEGRQTPRVEPPSDFVRWIPGRRPAAPEAAAAGLREAEQRIEQAASEGAEDLDLSDLGLDALPASLCGLTGLTELYLHDNRLTALPDEVSGLTRLTRLYASGNLLTALPDSLGDLAELTNLNVNENRLTALPETIGKLGKLEFLGLVGNRLRALPDSIGGLANLAKLYAPGNELAELPESISRLTRLRELWLSDNALTRLPAGLDNLSTLTMLALDGNPVSRRRR